ncbi:MAG: AAA family ATPase [Pseudomonadota bacterium]
MTRGFLLGKVMPPHSGHVYLCDFARVLVDQLTILVCSQERDPIPGALRLAWMQELFPSCRVLHLDEEEPQEPSEHAEFWPIWQRLVRRFHPEPVDAVFASEPYGVRLAKDVGARFVPVDLARSVVPVSAREIRRDPLGHWRYLPPPVRPYYVKKVCLFGPESTGKSTLAKALAAHFETVFVPEYARAYTDRFGTDCSREDLLRIAVGQSAAATSSRLAAPSWRTAGCGTEPFPVTLSRVCALP